MKVTKIVIVIGFILSNSVANGQTLIGFGDVLKDAFTSMYGITGTYSFALQNSDSSQKYRFAAKYKLAFGDEITEVVRISPTDSAKSRNVPDSFKQFVKRKYYATIPFGYEYISRLSYSTPNFDTKFSLGNVYTGVLLRLGQFLKKNPDPFDFSIGITASFFSISDAQGTITYGANKDSSIAVTVNSNTSLIPEIQLIFSVEPVDKLVIFASYSRQPMVFSNLKYKANDDSQKDILNKQSKELPNKIILNQDYLSFGFSISGLFGNNK
jgi:hypothetical protein